MMGKVSIRKRSSISFVPLGFPFAEEVLRVFPALLDPSVEHITESDKLLRGTKKKKKIFIFYCVFSQAALWYLRMLVVSLCYSIRMLSRRYGS